MKTTSNILLCMVVAALTLLACTADDIVTNNAAAEDSYPVDVQFCVQRAADYGTRSKYSDGTRATYLTYAAYKRTLVDDEYIISDLVTSEVRANIFSNTTATPTIKLYKNQSYEIFFWADAGPVEAPYTFDLENKTVSVDFPNDTTALNNESLDCFFGRCTVESVDEEMTDSVKLIRPLGQLNFGSNDLNAEILASNSPVGEMTFTLTIPGGYIPQTINLVDSSTVGVIEKDITFTATGVPATSAGTYPVSGYEYVAMTYLLCPKDTAITFNSTNPLHLNMSHSNLIRDIDLYVDNAPLKRNYRLNIYGSLLTVPTDYQLSLSTVSDTTDNLYSTTDTE